MKFSRRVSTHFIGRLSAIESAAISASSPYTSSLLPNPPPTSGAMTRTWCSGRRTISATVVLTTCGIWVDVHRVNSPPLNCATTPRVSIAVGTSRCWTRRRDTVASAVENASSTEPPYVTRKQTLVCSSGWITSAPGRIAAPTWVTAASGSYVTSTRSAASRAAARSVATTAATGSPTCRTTPSITSGYRLGTFMSLIRGPIGSGPQRAATSSPVQIATTPAAARAFFTSMAGILAWACGLRTRTTCSRPGGTTSSTYVAVPVMSRGSSRRFTRAPRAREITMRENHLPWSNFGLRIADCGFYYSSPFNPQSAIRNPQSSFRQFSFERLEELRRHLLGHAADQPVPDAGDQPGDLRIAAVGDHRPAVLLFQMQLPAGPDRTGFAAPFNDETHVLRRDLVCDAHLSRIRALDRPDAELDDCLKHIVPLGLQLFHPRSGAGQHRGIVEQLPHPLPWRGEYVRPFHFHGYLRVRMSREVLCAPGRNPSSNALSSLNDAGEDVRKGGSTSFPASLSHTTSIDLSLVVFT